MKRQKSLGRNGEDEKPYEWMTEVETELKRAFPKRGTRISIKDFRHKIRELGGYPRTTTAIRRIGEFLLYKERDDSIKVNYNLLGLLTYQTKDDYFCSIEEEVGEHALNGNPEYLEWKRNYQARVKQREEQAEMTASSKHEALLELIGRVERKHEIKTLAKLLGEGAKPEDVEATLADLESSFDD